MNPRPEIVLPPGFALRIDYEPESSPASLLITAYRDEAPIAQAHLDPREIGQRLRLEVEKDSASAEQPRLRLTPQRAMRAIVMGAVQEPAPRRELPPAVGELADGTRDRAVAPAEAPEPPALMTLREMAREGAFDDRAVRTEARPWTRMRRAIRTFSIAAADVLGNPLRLRDADTESWPSWRASWRGAHQPSGASEG